MGMDERLLSRPSFDSEVNDLVNGDQEVHDSYMPSRETPRKSTYLLLSMACNILLTAVLIWILLFFPNQEKQLSSQYDGFTTSTSFNESDLQYQSIKENRDEIWHSLTRQRPTGIVEIADGDEVKIGGIAMFHYLHCLNLLRKSLRQAMAGEDIGANWEDGAHGPHCLDYLRKGILCFADPTIELPLRPINTTLGEGSPGANGAIDLDIKGHESRMCRDPAYLYELRRTHMWQQPYPPGYIHPGDIDS